MHKPRASQPWVGLAAFLSEREQMQSPEERSDAATARRISRRTALGVGVAGIGLAAGAERFALAQDATPAASPVAEPHAGHGATPPSATPQAAAGPPFVPISGQPLADASRHASMSGELSTTMEMAVSPVMFAGQSVLSAVPNGSFPGPTIVLNPGESYSFDFKTPGTYVYNCSYHPTMQGMIDVN